MVQKEVKNFSFSLQKIITEQFFMLETYQIDNNAIRLETKLKFGLNKTNQVLAVFPTFKFDINNKPFLMIKVGCYFQMTKATWEQFDKKHSILFPKNFIRHVSAIAIGTTRGILHAKTENTVYNSYLLPTINVNELVVDDIKL